MLFYVHAHDNPGVENELEELSEDHWSYMDKFHDRLVLRGPTLSADGEEHTGSVHIVDLPDRDTAEVFATEEPFCRAGLYGEVAIAPALAPHRGEIPANDEGPTTLVTALWPATPLSDSPNLDTDSVAFLAVLTDDEQTHSIGLVAVTTTVTDAADAIVQPLADHLSGETVQLAVQNWQRGGRR